MASLAISNSNFTENAALNGNLFLDSLGSVVLANCSFKNNYSYLESSAVLTYYTDHVLITGCAFHNNSGTQHSNAPVALYMPLDAIITGSSFKHNKAGFGASALFVHQPNTTDIADCSFVFN